MGPRNLRSFGTGSRRLWQRQRISRWQHRIRFAVRGGYSVVGERVETRPGTATQTEVERNRTPHQAATPPWQAYPGCGTRVGDELTFLRLENGALADKNSQGTRLPFYHPTSSSCTS